MLLVHGFGGERKATMSFEWYALVMLWPIYLGIVVVVGGCVAADIALGFQWARIERQLRERELVRRESDAPMAQEKDIMTSIKEVDGLWHVRLENNTDSRVGDGYGATVDEAWNSMTWATLH
jgi:hypothetical protein